MPLDWDEVSPRLDPAVFNIKTAERRIGATAPWTDFFRKRQTLPRRLTRCSQGAFLTDKGGCFITGGKRIGAPIAREVAARGADVALY